MRFRMCLGFATLVAIVAASAISSNHAAQTSTSDQSERTKALMKERRDVLAKRVSAIEEHYKAGLCTIELVIDARDDLFAAKLDLAETRENRTELLKSRLKNLKEGEQYLRELRKVGSPRASEADALFSTSRRLLAEIELERALASD